MNKPKIKKENIDCIYTNKYLNMYGMHFDNGSFYLQSSRRAMDNLTVLKDDEEYKEYIPDAVSCILVIKLPNEEPRLYLQYEFRYPIGHFLLSPPAGLIDASDCKDNNPLIEAAKREIKEETGIIVKDTDVIKEVSRAFFSSAGMTDESNGMVFANVFVDNLDSLNFNGAEGTEVFSGYKLLTKEEARKLVEDGKDTDGGYFSIYTWASLMYFLLMC